MDAKRYSLIKDLAGRCLELPRAAREDFLERECGDDAELRAEVESLLSYESGPLDRHLDAGAVERAPEQIGGHRIVRELGRGGMGVVFEAEQDDPKRRVALKVLGGAWVTPDLTARFLREAEALARLSHPAIAAVHETGSYETELGPRPYFTMEFVAGRDLLGHADEKRLDLEARLEMLARVADAVHHAHEKGVVHRDLKPDNILVREDGLPKVLDFGIAQIVDEAQDGARLTEQGQVLGTLDYLSPEQVTGEVAAIGPATDVHALGVIGFELLSGELPYILAGRSLTEAARIITQEPPLRRGRGGAGLPKDVETILGKALEKEPRRRYESAAAFAADIRRFLRREVITARPASLLYRAGRFAQRNRELVVATSAVFVILLGALLVTLDQARSLERSRDAEARAKTEAQGKQKEAEAARDAERAAREKADDRLRQADALTAFMSGIITMAQPDEKGLDVTVVDALRFADAAIEDNFGAHPENELAIRSSLGRLYVELGLQDDAEDCLESALAILDGGVEDDETESSILFNLSQLALRRDDVEKAVALAEKAIPLHGGSAGETDPARLASLLDGLATAVSRRRDQARALQLSGEAMRLVAGRDTMGAAVITNNYGRRLNSLGRYTEGEARGREALQIVERIGRSDTPQYAFMLHELARCLSLQGRREEALPMRRDALALAKKHLPAEHINVAALAIPLAQLLQREGDFEESLRLAEDALAIFLKTLPPGNPNIAACRVEVALSLIGLDRLDEAEEIALELWRPAEAPDEPPVAGVVALHADLAEKRQDLEGAIELRRLALGLRAERYSGGGRHPVELRTALARTLRRAGRLEEAATEFEAALAEHEAELGAGHPDTIALRRLIDGVSEAAR